MPQQEASVYDDESVRGWSLVRAIARARPSARSVARPARPSVCTASQYQGRPYSGDDTEGRPVGDRPAVVEHVEVGAEHERGKEEAERARRQGGAGEHPELSSRECPLEAIEADAGLRDLLPGRGERENGDAEEPQSSSPLERPPEEAGPERPSAAGSPAGEHPQERDHALGGMAVRDGTVGGPYREGKRAHRELGTGTSARQH